MLSLIAPREPFSAWSHGLWLVLSIPATYWLWKRSNDNRARRWSLLVFGVCLTACYLGSAVYHGVRTDPKSIELFARMDHIGIHLLIAGSYTPLAWNLLRGRWRWGTLSTVWGVTFLAVLLLALDIRLPRSVSTSKYLLLGWGALICHVELTRVLSWRELRALVIGGLLYSVGAMLNLFDWPILWPGVVGSHEVFHLWVMAGSLAHYCFMLTIVAPHPVVADTESAPILWTRVTNGYRRLFRRPLPVTSGLECQLDG